MDEFQVAYTNHIRRHPHFLRRPVTSSLSEQRYRLDKHAYAPLILKQSWIGRLTVKSLFLAIVALTLALQLSTPAHAEMSQTDAIVFDPVNIMAVMNENATTALIFNAQVSNVGLSPVTSVSVRIDSQQTELVTAEVDFQPVDGAAVLRDRYTEVSVALPESLEPNSSVWLHLELKADDLQSLPSLSEDSSRLRGDFIFYIRPFASLANLTFTAVLPRFASLSLDSLVPLFPVADSNFTDGHSLVFVWKIALLQPGQERVFIIKYQLPNTSTIQAQSTLVGGLLFGTLGLAAGLLLAFGGPRVAKRVKQLRAVRYVGVTGEEEEVLTAIREKGGSCTQKDLYSQFDISQSKMSLILTNLEQRGLIRRFKDGRENTVHIIEQE